ncbi:MAG: hypothetical protein RLY71_166 [Pseudomonadota bacterium]|jgi:hypothetical protein
MMCWHIFKESFIMKKQLLILAGLTIMFGAQASDAPQGSAKAAQDRAAEYAKCTAEAKGKGLQGQDFKDAITACRKLTK